MLPLQATLTYFHCGSGCRWKSARCTVQFHYDEFLYQNARWFYLETRVLAQLCRKHLRAGRVTLPKETVTALCNDFRHHVCPIETPSAAVENAEEVGLVASEPTEEKLFEAFTRYQREFRERALANRARREKPQVVAAKRTKGKHVSALCQGCLAGVCSYVK